MLSVSVDTICSAEVHGIYVLGKGGRARCGLVPNMTYLLATSTENSSGDYDLTIRVDDAIANHVANSPMTNLSHACSERA